MKTTFLLLVAALTLLAATQVKGQDNLHVLDQDLQVEYEDRELEVDYEDELNYPADLMLIESDNSRASSCKQKKSCTKKSGGTCKANGTCTGKSTKGCSRGCDCCLPIPTADQCTTEGGSCLKAGDICNGTIKIIYNSCKDQCTCCVPDGSECVGGVRIGNKCLNFSADSLNWTQAATACANKSSQLASIGDIPYEVLDYTIRNYANVTFWVGGSDTAKEGNWTWQSGKPFDKNFPWAWRQPDSYGGNQDCLVVNYQRGYDDGTCAGKKRYICEDCVGGVRIGYKCLHFSNNLLNWTSAVTACASKSGRLATFEDNPYGILDHVVKNYANVTFWAGGSDTAKEGSWVWQSSKPFDKNFPWSWGNPNNYGGNQDCLSVNWHRSYDDDTCTVKKRFICEIPDKE